MRDCTDCEAYERIIYSLRGELAVTNEKLSEWENAAKFVHDEACSGDQMHCPCVPVLRGEVASLKSALAEAKAENERLREVCSLLASEQKEYARLAWEPGRMPGNEYWSDRFMVVVRMANEALAARKDGSE